MHMRTRLLTLALAVIVLPGCSLDNVNPPTTPTSAAVAVHVVQIGPVPATPAAFGQLQKDLGRTPQGAAAAMVAVMLACNQDEKLGMTCATMLLHPDNLRKGSLYDGQEPGQTYRDYLRGSAAKPFVARSYLLGATPANGYQPQQPLRVSWRPHAQPTPSVGRFRVLLLCSGADTPRPVTLRRDAAGLWKVDEASSLFVGVRPPAGP
ncbi:MAG: hypothetical protein BIFFINMI_00661 [Phycisphaerae bacterium]|nr:hypothetical protein [Phycisphaerae bacterium]